MDLTQVRKDIRSLLSDRNHDDGSWGPVFLRLAWHCCGTYDKDKGTGGSNGCTMRFEAEQKDPENAGLSKARERLETVKAKHPHLSYADIYILAGYVALEAMGGPSRIPFKSGRVDMSFEEAVSVHGPSAADLGPDPTAPRGAPMHVQEAPTVRHVRDIFTRLGFNDRETVALIVLGHQFGRAHLDVSGYENPWYGFDPTHWNVYEGGLGYLSAYTMGRQMFRETTTAKGKRQYQANLGGAMFMMLIADMALVWDPEFRRHLEAFDRDRRAFAREAIEAWVKLTELGCPPEQLVPEAGAS